MTFVDLEIRIFPRAENGYPVEITLGEQQEFPRGIFCPEESDIDSWNSGNDLAASGQQMFKALFRDEELRKAWDTSRAKALQRRIRLRIDARAPELHTLPWELLQDQVVLLSANENTPFSRYLPIELPWRAAVKERPIRVLVAISNPNDLPEDLAHLDVDLERETLEAAFGHIGGNEFRVKFLEPPITLTKLATALRDDEYHIVHYLGHGAFSSRRQQAALYLQDEEGNTKVVEDNALIKMLAHQKTKPRLIFLAACQSATHSSADAFRGLGPKLVALGVPVVVAMQGKVEIDTARELSQTFYQKLAEHGVVDQAMNEARNTLGIAERPDAAVPVLFMRLKSGQLWSSEVDKRGQVLGGSGEPHVFWSTLVRHIQRTERCIPIIGPRVHGRWLPTPMQVSKKWSEEHRYPFVYRDELTKVAQYLATAQGERFLREEYLAMLMENFIHRLPEASRPENKPKNLTELIRATGWQNLVTDNPNQVHQILADLNLPLYLTTNPDSFMIEALKAQDENKQPVRALCRWNEKLSTLGSQPGVDIDENYEPTSKMPLVYHLFGSDEYTDSLVITEDHYLDFLTNTLIEKDIIPYSIRSKITDNTLLFIGYSLYDWEFRVIMRALVATVDQKNMVYEHVAVQLEDVSTTNEGTAQRFLQKYFQKAKINIFWGSPMQFAAELREHWEDNQR